MIVKLIFILIILRVLGELYLSRLNARHVQKNSATVPAGFEEYMDQEKWTKSVNYTLIKSSFGRWEMIWGALILVAILYFEALPKSWEFFTAKFGSGIWIQSLWLFSVSFVMSLFVIPFDLWSQFVIEERFGFNNSSFKLWFIDQIKGTALGFLISWPLLALLLFIVQWMGEKWWLIAAVIMIVFQLIMMVVVPTWIMPLFNKFEELEEGSLRARLMELCKRTGFPASTVLVMDGSKRSGHSNAFFTGFGSFRRIVLYDTLIEQMQEDELEAVLAHEIGHWKLGHIPKMLLLSSFFVVGGFWVVDYFANQAGFLQAFGFQSGNMAAVFLFVSLLADAVLFWVTPLFNMHSRKNEYAADAFAKQAMQGDGSILVRALKKMSSENLSNLNPHPLFSGFYYSHPAYFERERALLADTTK